MEKVIFGNHSSVIVPRKDRDSIRKFYCDVLGGIIARERRMKGTSFDWEKTSISRFFMGMLLMRAGFLRTARSVWLEIKSDNVEEMSRTILGSGLCRKLDIPDPHLYFSSPGGTMLAAGRNQRGPLLFMRALEKVQTWQR